MPADTNGFPITSSTSFGSFEEVRRPSSFRSIRVRQRQPVMLFSSRFRRPPEVHGDRQQPGLAVAMRAPKHTNAGHEFDKAAALPSMPSGKIWLRFLDDAFAIGREGVKHLAEISHE